MSQLRYVVEMKIPLDLHTSQNNNLTLGFKSASLLIVKGYANEIVLLVVSMFSEPVKLIFVNKLSTSALL